jgi:hypothetical protein
MQFGGHSLTPSDKARRRNGRESVAAHGAENSRVEPGEPIQEMVDFILEAEPAGNMVDEFEEHAIAKRPYARGVTLPAQSAGLRGAARLHTGRDGFI